MSDTSAFTGTSEAAPEVVDSGPDAAAVESQATPVEGTQPAENPAWGAYRSKLGDKFFELIKDDLASDDKRVQTRISESNAKYKPYEDLGSLEDLQQAMGLAQQVGTDPKAVYERLGEWLRANGQLEAAEAVEEQVADLSDEHEGKAEADPRLDELAKGQKEIKDFFEAQQNQQAIERETGILQSQMASIKEANKWVTEDDENEILSRALSKAQSSGKEVDLAAAASEYVQLRTRFLQTPRPGDSAPDLVPTGGGAPAQNSNFDFSKAGKADRSAYLAEWLKSNS